MMGLDACICKRIAANGTAVQAVQQVSWMGHSDSYDRAAGDVIFVKFPNKTEYTLLNLIEFLENTVYV